MQRFCSIYLKSETTLDHRVIKFNLKSIFIAILAIAIVLAIYVWAIAVPRNVVEVIDQLAKIEKPCSRSELWRILNMDELPEFSTLNSEKKSGVLLCEVWDLGSSFQLFVAYKPVDNELVFVKGYVTDSNGVVVENK